MRESQRRAVATRDEASVNATKITATAAAIAILTGTGWFYKRADGREAPAVLPISSAPP